MTPTFQLRYRRSVPTPRLVIAFFTLTVTLPFLCGCGQMGALYQPEPENTPKSNLPAANTQD